MDHFWVDGESQREPESVPVVGLTEYDCNEWTTFPQRLGYPTDFYKLVTANNEDAVEATGMRLTGPLYLSAIQEWIFFGCLIEIFGTLGLHVRREDLIREHEGQRRLSTVRLNELFTNLIQKRVSERLRITPEIDADIYHDIMKDDFLRRLPVEEAKDAKRRVKEVQNPEDYVKDLGIDVAPHYLLECNDRIAKPARSSESTMNSHSKVTAILEKAAAFLETADRHLISIGKDDLAGSGTVLACILILETLQGIAETALKGPIMVLAFGMLRYAKPLAVRFRESNLCRTRMDNLVLPSRCYAASLLKRPVRRDHSECALHECRVPAESSNSLPKHNVECDGSCGLKKLNEESEQHLLRHLDSGSFAVLQRGPQEGSFEVVEQSACGAYVAFSHVWSHGLGNPERPPYGVLPTCQLERLSQLCSMLDSNCKAFWVDTLLVPRQQPHRQLSISRMVEIYRKAKAVIVVDQDLTSATGPRLSKALHVWLSDWMTRLWTLQEGLLSVDKLHFAFKDEIVSLYELTQGLYHLKTSREILAGPAHPVFIGKHILGDTDTGTRDLMELARPLRARSTTKWWDEAICLSTLLGLNVLELPYHPRFEDMLQLMSKAVPMELMFIKGPRSDLPGFRWAPRTLLYGRSSPPGSLAPTTQSILGPKGLRLVKDVILLDDAVTVRKPLFLVQRAKAPSSANVSLEVTVGEDDDSSDDLEMKALNRPALVLVVRPEQVAENMNLKTIGGLTIDGVIVSDVQKDGDDELCAHYAVPTTIVFDESILGSFFQDFPMVRGTLVKDMELWVD